MLYPCKGIDHVFLGHTPLSIVTLGNCHFIDTGSIGHKLTVLNINAAS